MRPPSRRCSSARAPSSAAFLVSGARSSALFLRKHLFEGAHGDTLVDAAAVEGVGGDQNLGFLARSAVHHDQRAGARSVRRVLERPAEDYGFRIQFQEILVSGAMRVAQGRGVGTVETNDGVHGMVRGYG